MKPIIIFCFAFTASLSVCLNAQVPSIDFAIGINSNHPGGGGTRKVIVDNSGNTYIVGVIQGTTDFDPTASTANLVASDADGFLAKYDGNGNYLWAIKIGSTNYDQIYGVAVDDSGYVYIAGSIEGTVDMDPGIGVANVSCPVSGVVIAKYDSSSNYVWAYTISGPSPTGVNDLYLDANANLYITGSYGNTVDFDPFGAVANLTMGPGLTYDMYLAKYNSNGGYIWARGLNTIDAGVPNAIGVDNNGNVYLGGVFNGTVDFDPGAGTFNLNCSNPGNIFLAKYTSAGNYTWALQMGDAANNESILDLEIDGIGNIVVTGSFQGTNATDFNPGAGIDNHTPHSAVYTDGFVAKYSPAGIYIFAHSFGGDENDFGLGVAVDAARNVYVTGYFTDTVDFDPGASTSILVTNGISPDFFITKYSLTGNFVWAAGIGGTSVESARSIAVNNDGELWVTGTFSSPFVDFDPSAGSYPASAPGANTIFLAKYDYCTPVNLSEVSHTDVSCFNGNNGSIHLHTTGTAPFNYNWQPSGGADSIATNLTAGSYTCTVTSSCGTVDAISIVLTQPALLDPFIVSQTNLFCNGDSTGSAQVDATGGLGTYDYNWLPGGMNTSSVTNLLAGTYTCTITDDNMCTASQTITITQPAAIVYNHSPQLCAGDSMVIGSSVYNSTGVFVNVFTAFNGCDSTVTTNLTVHSPVDTGVGISGITLTSNVSGGTYQWVDCNNAFSPFVAETFQTFIPLVNGSYAVIVTQNGCADTSACYLINSVGIEEFNTKISVYPNPFHHYFTIDISSFENDVDVFVTDISGKLIHQFSILKGNIHTFYPQVSSGVYLLHVRSEQKYEVIKLISK